MTEREGFCKYHSNEEKIYVKQYLIIENYFFDKNLYFNSEEVIIRSFPDLTGIRTTPLWQILLTGFSSAIYFLLSLKQFSIFFFCKKGK